MRQRLRHQMMRASVIFVLGICVFPFPAAIFFGYVLPRTTPQIIRYCAIFATAALGIHGLLRLQLARMRCRRCGVNLSKKNKELLEQERLRLRGVTVVAFCPHCGASLDEPIPP
jgi:hypothetical protein